LEETFKDIIDLSDLKNKSERDVRNSFLSRSLAAYILMHRARIDRKTAASAVIDGYNDNGIDAIYFDRGELLVYIVQSKWKYDGKSSPDLGSIRNFISGFKDLIDGEFSRFNEKFSKMKEDLSEALYNAKAAFILIIAYTGNEPISRDGKRAIQDVLKELNEPISLPLASYEIYGLADIYKAISGAADGAHIKLDVMLRNWGHIESPYPAYYGQIDAADVVDWWETYSTHLFAPNLRKFLGSNTDVNESIIETLKTNPENFWYFNNGIIVLCSNIKLKPMGRGSKKANVFECDDVSIVNGAQTVGCIAMANSINPKQVEKASVLAKFISLEKSPESFASEITRAANTQNRIDRRDFVSLDDEQKRLQSDLYMDCKKIYVYKRGDEKPALDVGCDIEEATIALACSYPDVELAVQAKREIGKLWEDIKKPPYKLLFNPNLSAVRLWRSVEILRIVESSLEEEKVKKEGRDRLIAIHGNRFILHLVFKCLSLEKNDEKSLDMKSIKILAANETKVVLKNLTKIMNKEFKKSYPANLFKNKAKCVEAVSMLQKIK